MHVPQNPTVIDIAHNVFNRGKGLSLAWHVIHGEPYTGNQLVDQNHQRQYAKEIPEIKVLRCIVGTHVRIPRTHDWQALVNPASQIQ